MGHKHGVAKVNQGGGLALLWKQDIDIRVDDSSPNYINAIFNSGKENSQRFSGFYGALEMHNHHISQNILHCLNHKFSIPWLCVGDFNEIGWAYKKYGGKNKPYKQMQDFYDILEECDFIDLGFVGNKFTWCKNFQSLGCVQVILTKLDGLIRSMEVETNLTSKCRIFVISQTNLVLLIQDLWGISLHCVKIFLMEVLFGSGWIEQCAMMNG